MPQKRATKSTSFRLTKIKLDALVDEATVDAHDEDEQRMGFFTMIQDNLGVPFETIVLGAPVVVEKVDLNKRDEIVAICVRGRERQAVPIVDLPLPSPPPKGVEWIEAYRHWACGGQGDE
ncbi:MAG: hypothetical protein HY716_09145 [Planctomycetes bacterium]|nr:hypothetical protein [Planctomycetota bacterium]